MWAAAGGLAFSHSWAAFQSSGSDGPSGDDPRMADAAQMILQMPPSMSRYEIFHMTEQWVFFCSSLFCFFITGQSRARHWLIRSSRFGPKSYKILDLLWEVSHCSNAENASNQYIKVIIQ